METLLVIQWLGVCTSTTGGTGSIPGLGTKIPHAAWHGWGKKNVGPSSTNSLLHDPGQMLAVLGLHFPICKMGAITALSGSVWIK